jgi:enterochelin esterase-like enzyme
MSRSVSAFRQSRGWTPVINAAVAAVVVVAAVASGTIDASNTTLVGMGFDADRAQLITSLLVGGVAAAAATLATNRSGQATLCGFGAFAALFGPTFLTETGSALASTGIDGSFDLAGWLLTLLTLVTSGVISSWAGAALALALRPGLIEAGSAVADAVSARRLNRRLLWRPLAVALVLILLIVTVPVFGGMVNYTPDSRMLHGGAPPVGLIPGGPTDSQPPAGESPSPSGSTGTSPTPQPTGTTGTSPTPQPTGTTGTSPTPHPTPSPNQQPWLSWRPSGRGSVTIVELPAPWKGSWANTDGIGIYTPPGYDPHGSRRYPVLYEAPTGFQFWDSATNVKVALDTLIDTGAIPPVIVVFVDANGAPFPTTECANSVDGRMWMDTFISHTAVAYVDSHYLTIARTDARAITGMSQGGYCAAILALRHPAVFGTSIPFSGYYQAGSGGANSRLPFGGNAAALSAASPMVVATELPAAERASLFFIVVVEPSQAFYGAQASEFEHLLVTYGYPSVALNAQVPHGWAQVRQEFPVALETWAAHLVAVGIF